ncbi:MAG: methyltransferase domain-containing protein, partial [bacterium]
MNTFIAPSFPRCLENETLDQLPESDLRAVRSRQDLQRINRIMGSARIISGALSGGGCTPMRVIELGAGDGTTMLRVAQNFQEKWPQVHVTLLDRQHLVSNATCSAFRQAGWTVNVICQDLQEWMRAPGSQKWDVVVANLFVHHFDVVHIASLFRALCERTDLFIACEPRRTRRSLLASRLVGM